MTGPFQSLILIHGAGSTGRFMRQAFAGVAVSHTVTVEDRSGEPAQIRRAIDRAARALPRPLLVAGVSLGAHAAALWATGSGAGRLDALGLLLPAWTGEPDAVARMSTSTAAQIRDRGRDTVLREITEITEITRTTETTESTWGTRSTGAAAQWVVQDLRIDWPAYGDRLATALESAGRSAAPTPAQLASIQVPCGVVALRADPLHPEAVARQWAATLPHAHLVTLDGAAPAADRRVLGRAAVDACRLAAAAAPLPRSIDPSRRSIGPSRRRSPRPVTPAP